MPYPLSFAAPAPVRPVSFAYADAAVEQQTQHRLARQHGFQDFFAQPGDARAPFGAEPRPAITPYPATAHEQAYIAMGRAAMRSVAPAREESSPEAALPGAFLSATLSGASFAGAEQAALSHSAQLPFLRPGDRLSPSGATQAPSKKDQVAQRAGPDEARSPERSFMGGGAATPTASHFAPNAAKPATDDAAQQEAKSAQADDKSDKAGLTGTQLTEEEQAQIKAMKERDREVKTHEQAHIAAGGGLVRGGASYQTETGPDGKAYAVGGEVQIDTSEASSPEATMAKARRIKAAALAPADPSSQDRAVAAQAAQMESAARAEKQKNTQEKLAAPEEDGAENKESTQAVQTEAPDTAPQAGRSRLASKMLAAYGGSGKQGLVPHGFTRDIAV